MRRQPSQSLIVYILLLSIIAVLTFLLYNNLQQPRENNNNNSTIFYSTSMGPDPLLNPYAPPLRNEQAYLPINISTNIGAVDANYRQLGIITPSNSTSKDNILPLMGRPLFTNRDKWQYYSFSNQHNNVKLPISRAGKSCTNEYGCDRLFTGDTVYVEGVNETYRVTLYDNDTVRYLPI